MLEVSSLLGSSESGELSLMLGKTTSMSLGGLVSEIMRGVLGLLVLLLGLISLLLVEDGENLSNGLSNNL